MIGGGTSGAGLALFALAKVLADGLVVGKDAPLGDAAVFDKGAEGGGDAPAFLFRQPAVDGVAAARHAQQHHDRALGEGFMRLDGVVVGQVEIMRPEGADVLGASDRVAARVDETVMGGHQRLHCIQILLVDGVHEGMRHGFNRILHKAHESIRQGWSVNPKGPQSCA